MVLLDSREPVTLEDAVRVRGVEVSREVELEFGDCLFFGNGPGGDCSVVFERKKLDDLVTSMKDKRLSGHQIRGCRNEHDFVHLVCEGLWREGGGGEILVMKWDQRIKKHAWIPYYSHARVGGSDGNGGSRMAVSYEQLDHYLATLELKAGVIVKRTKDLEETARYYVSRWKWFNNKTWAEHTSHDQVYCGKIPVKGHGYGWAEDHEHGEEFGSPGGRVALISGSGREEQEPPTTLWRMACQLPGIVARARAVNGHFGTVFDMALAGLPESVKSMIRAWHVAHPGAAEKEWCSVEGARIGPKTSAAVVRAVMEKGA